MSDVTMQCLASLATGKALRAIDELCESQSRVATWKLSTLVATARSELGECAFQLRKSHDALLAERDQLRADRDSHQRQCIAEMEKNRQLRAELEAIRGQQLVGYQYQDRNGEWRGFCDEEHYQNTVEDGTWPIRAIYAVVSTKNAEEGE